MFGKKKTPQKIDIEKELDAILLFLGEAGDDLKKIYGYCKEMKVCVDREKEALKKKLPEIGLSFNTQEQVKVWDKMLKEYDFFDEDVEVNKQRVKMIAKELGKVAKERNIDPELLKKIETSIGWRFNW